MGSFSTVNRDLTAAAKSPRLGQTAEEPTGGAPAGRF